MRYSRQRNVILNIVKANPVHPTAEWVYEEAKKELPNIGVATVYRNLNALVDAGEIDRIPGVGGVDRFDGNREVHYHLKCNKCGKPIDLEPKSQEALQRMEDVIRETFDEAVEVCVNRMLLEGVCSQCSQCE